MKESTEAALRWFLKRKLNEEEHAILSRPPKLITEYWQEKLDEINEIQHQMRLDDSRASLEKAKDDLKKRFEVSLMPPLEEEVDKT